MEARERMNERKTTIRKEGQRSVVEKTIDNKKRGRHKDEK